MIKMNRVAIYAAAKEAGLAQQRPDSYCGEIHWTATADVLERFAQAAYEAGAKDMQDYCARIQQSIVDLDVAYQRSSLKDDAAQKRAARAVMTIGDEYD